MTLVDPPRPDAAQLIAALRDLGVAVKMLTGDALAVAREIAQGVGLPNIRRVADLKAAAAQAGNKAVDLLAGADGFAEVYPEDKYIVVQHLQAAGHVTGMTGDGVNDAPALRQAEVGIAVSSATDVAKGAASVVLTEPGLTNIVTLVEQGRTIYQRILTWIINKISRTILKAAFVAIAFVATGKFVVSAFAMLLLVFVTGFRDDRPGHRPCSPIQEAGDMEHRGLRPGVGGTRRRNARGVAPVPVDRLVAFRSGDEQQCAGHVQLPDTALFLRVFHRVGAESDTGSGRRCPASPSWRRSWRAYSRAPPLTVIGLPGLMPLPGWQTFAIFVYAMVACLLVNDAVKVAMIRWRVPAAVA